MVIFQNHTILYALKCIVIFFSQADGYFCNFQKDHGYFRNFRELRGYIWSFPFLLFNHVTIIYRYIM